MFKFKTSDKFLVLSRTVPSFKNSEISENSLRVLRTISDFGQLFETSEKYLTLQELFKISENTAQKHCGEKK